MKWWSTTAAGPTGSGRCSPKHFARTTRQTEGQTTDIEFEDANGQWHVELAEGGDRPETHVEDDSSQPRTLSRDVGAEEPLPDGPRRH